MIDIELLRKDPEAVKQNLAKRGVANGDVDQLHKLDKQWRQLGEEVDGLRAQQNEANDLISKASANDKDRQIAAMKKVANEVKEKSKQLTQVAEERKEAWLALPNLVSADVPTGTEAENEVLRTVPETLPKTDFEARSYLELMEPELIDTERAAKVSGSRFTYLKGELARLQMALVAYVFDELAKDDFTPVIPPVLVGERAMASMGYLGRHAQEVYQVQDDLYLVGTSEQAIGPMYMDEILKGEDLPLRLVGYSSCFRREAGSHGKDVRGILRLHQFDKVEMFSFTAPDKSEKEHEFLLAQQEKIWQALALPYQVVKLAAGDLGDAAAKTYDLETWIPSEERYRETHSTSNTTDYQARRLNIRFKNGGGIKKVHMLNGTAVAIGRTLISLIENHQQKDGSIVIPEVLHSYLPFTKIGSGFGRKKPVN